MRGKKFCWIPMALAGAVICPTAAFPNDSAAELSIGGLRFTRTNEITIDSEELRLSIDRVDVRYQFTNTSGKPVTLTVAFPLPDIDLAEAENIAFPSYSVMVIEAAFGVRVFQAEKETAENFALH